MRRFKLVRHKDISGVSGTGEVAEGTVFTDGSVAVRWYGNHPATAVWPSVEDVLAVHGHGGDTELVWIDAPVRPRGQWLYYEGNPSRVDHRDKGGVWHNSISCDRRYCGAAPADATRPVDPAGGEA